MEENQNLNTFLKGMSRDTSPEMDKNDVIYDSINGTLFSDKEGNVVWRPLEGNEQIIKFDTEQLDPDTDPLAPIDTGQSSAYLPLGAFSFEDCLVVNTIHETTNKMIIWVFQFNENEEAYGQILIGDLQFPSPNDFSQVISNKIKMRGVYENKSKYRVYWCDGVKDDSNPVRTLTFKINETTPSVTDPLYGGNTIEGTFKNFLRVSTDQPTDTNLMAPFDMGIIHFHKRINGSLLSGRYIYLYRLIREDGYRTPWSHHTNSVFVTTDPIDAFSEVNMHLYEMEASELESDKGHILKIYGIDQNYEQIETAYVYIPDATNVPTLAASFDFQNITGGIQEVRHISMAGETLNVDEMISLRLNITAAQSLDVHENHLWIENYKTERLQFTDAEIEAVFADLKVHHVFRDMAIDRKGKSDKSMPSDGEIGALFHTDTVVGTTKITLNDSQEMTYSVESDFPGYRGQQIDNTFVGYPRDETGRWAIVFWDKTGNPGFAYHAVDYRFPKMFNGDVIGDVLGERIRQDGTIVDVRDPSAFGVGLHKKAWLTTSQADPESISLSPLLERPIIEGDDPLLDELPYGNPTDGYMKETYARTMGIMFNGIDVSGIKDRISGFSIHRMKMEHTTVAQGIVSPVSQESGGDPAGSNNTVLRPSFIPYTTISNHGSTAGVFRPIVPHNRFVAHPATPPISHKDWFWDRNTCVLANVFGDHANYRWNPDFTTMYCPGWMFDPGEVPAIQTGDFIEMVQQCWEEFNYMGIETARRAIAANMDWATTGTPTPTTNTHRGPALCNMFFRPLENVTPPYDEEVFGTKLSWHLMVNTRHRHHFPAGVIVGNPEDGYPIAGNPIISAGVLGSSDDAAVIDDFRIMWNDNPRLFPRYGDFFVPEHARIALINETLDNIDPANPGWRFSNDMTYFINSKDSTSGSGPNYPAAGSPTALCYANHVPKYDDFYGGRTDSFLMDGYNNSNEKPAREGIGHDNTMVFKYNGQMYHEDGSNADADFVFSPQLASYAWAVTNDEAYLAQANMACVSRWIVNWKRPIAAPYGGQSLTALQSNIFVGTGHFQPVGNAAFDADIAQASPTLDVYNNIEVYGGETWLDLHSGTIVYPNNVHEKDTVGSSLVPCPPTGDYKGSINGGSTARLSHPDFGYIMIFPYEAKTNLGLRNAPSPGGPNSASVGLRPAADYNNHTTYQSSGLFYFGGRRGDAPDPLRHLLDEYFINEVLGYQDRFRPFLYEPRSFNGVEHYPVRVQYNRSQKVYGDPVDVFREILVNDWDDLIGQYGPIYASAVFMDRLFILQAKAFSRLRIYEKAMMPSDEGAITLGDGTVLNGTDYKSEHFGAQSVYAVTTTPKGLYWVDIQQKAILFSDGEKAINLSDVKAMNTPLRELLWRYVGGDSIYGEKGLDVHVDYDPSTNKVYFSFPSLTEAVGSYLNQSKRYRQFDYAYILGGIVYGASHNVVNITFVDHGDANPQVSGVENVVHVREYDIIRLFPLTTPTEQVAFQFKLLRGLYGSDLADPKAFTVLEFYIIIPLTHIDGWVAEFGNYKETSGDLTTPDEVLPSLLSSTEKEGYLYTSAQYTNPIDQEIKHDSYEAVFRLYRTHADSPFQVQLIATDSKDPTSLSAGGNLRSMLVFDEDAEKFEGWRNKGHIFGVEHKKRLMASVENNLQNGVFAEGIGTRAVSEYFGEQFIAFVSANTNEKLITDKIWDNIMLRVRHLDDMKSVRFSTETHAIMLPTATDRRAEHKRRYSRLPVRRESQLDRVRGTYVRIEVEFISKRNKTAYLVDLRTGYTISDLT